MTDEAPIALSRHASYGALVRRVRTLRDAVSEYDRETAERKRKAERQGGPPARFAVDQLRSPAFHNLRKRLRVAEHQLANWKRPEKVVAKDDHPFSEVMREALRPKGYGK